MAPSRALDVGAQRLVGLAELVCLLEPDKVVFVFGGTGRAHIDHGADEDHGGAGSMVADFTHPLEGG